MTNPPPRTCPACGQAASGSFCSHCGASLGARACAFCRAELSPHARFCHRCGHPVAHGTGAPASGPSNRGAWIVAGMLCVLLVGGIAYKVSSGAPRAATPNMANAGGVTAGDQSPGGTGTAGDDQVPGRAPDISSMTPRERFDRLFNRIMQAAQRNDSGEVRRFTPMALGAYDQLDSRDIDARYHAAVLHMGVGDFAPAYALADTILRESPGHLFGYVIRGTVAGFQGDTAVRSQAEREFLAHYRSEMAAKRVEYLEHKPVLEEFKQEAEKTAKTAK
jgi:hypothetical protein